MGSFPTYFFAFPLNVILAVIMVIAVASLYANAPKSLFVRFMLSRSATILSLTLFLGICLVIGFTGNRELVQSWIFIIIVFNLLTVLLFVILRGWRRRNSNGVVIVRWRFLLLHLGLLLALGSGFWGAPDSRTLRLQLFEGTQSNEAYQMDGKSVWPPYQICLNGVEIDTWDNGVPSYTAANIVVDGKEVTVSVNHPYTKRLGEDIYITAYGDAEDGHRAYCILQIVKEPWKYGMAAGIFMLLAGALLLFLNGPRGTIIKEE